jgi:hypothetical protein
MSSCPGRRQPPETLHRIVSVAMQSFPTLAVKTTRNGPGASSKSSANPAAAAATNVDRTYRGGGLQRRGNRRCADRPTARSPRWQSVRRKRPSTHSCPWRCSPAEPSAKAPILTALHSTREFDAAPGYPFHELFFVPTTRRGAAGGGALLPRCQHRSAAGGDRYPLAPPRGTRWRRLPLRGAWMRLREPRRLQPGMLLPSCPGVPRLRRGAAGIPAGIPPESPGELSFGAPLRGSAGPGVAGRRADRAGGSRSPHRPSAAPCRCPASRHDRPRRGAVPLASARAAIRNPSSRRRPRADPSCPCWTQHRSRLPRGDVPGS